MRAHVRVVVLLGVLCVGGAPVAARTIAVTAATPAGPSNCYPFAHNFYGKYHAFIYKNVPPFHAAPGDVLSFDLGATNDTTIVLDIAMAATTVNGGDVPSGSFVTVASDATPSAPMGDTIAGNFELGFTLTQPFSFPGGGLIIRFKAKGAQATDTTCEQNLMYASSTDTSGFFVKRTWEDADGVPPWDHEDNSYIGQFRLVTTSELRVAVEMVASSPSQAAETVAQLNDSTWASIQATRVTAADVDTEAELAQYDVLVIGNSGQSTTDRDWTPALANTWAAWVASGRGSVVSTAWIAYSLSSPLVEMDPLVPFSANPSSGYNYCPPTTTTTITDSTHPVTTGVASFTAPSGESPATAIEGTVLATDSCGGNNVIVGTSGSGRTVYLGVPYLGSVNYAGPQLRAGDADRLLEQAVAWAGDNDDDGLPNSVDCAPTDPLGGDSVPVYADADGDGFGTGSTLGNRCAPGANESVFDTDCDDSAANVNPGEMEVCDPFDVDEDCDGGGDDADPQGDAIGRVSVYTDGDGDGYGTGALLGSECDLEPNEAANDTDCDDATMAVHPGATDTVGDLVDDDCDAMVVCWADADQDGARDAVATQLSSDLDCSDPGEQLTAAPIDCADNNDTRYPGATELVNGVDDDCDGTIDENTTAYDDDGDGFSEAGGDCNDTDSALHPGAAEPADGIDNDCDGAIDEGTSVFDDDGDSFTEDAGDCNDDSATVYPGAPETANGVDDDCDGTVDEGTSAFDDDADGFTEDGGDCDDSVAAVNPDATEIANGIDDDCDGVIDGGDDGGGCCSANRNESPWTSFLLVGLVAVWSRRRRGRRR